jgi:hypothetical protein
MCQIARLFLLHRLKGRMSGDVRGFNNNDTRAVMNNVINTTNLIHALLSHFIQV